MTANAEDFLTLARRSEMHPGLILIREGELSRDEQFDRILAALNVASELESTVNVVIDVHSILEIEVLRVPPT